MTRKEEDAQAGPKTDDGTEKSEREDFARRRRKLIAYAYLTGFGRDRRCRDIRINRVRHPPIMRTSLKAKTLLYPQPVYIIGTYDEDGTPNAMNAAWGGIMGEDKVSICIDRGHRTTANFKRTGAFTVSPATVDTSVAADYVGIVSGNDVPDKVARAGFHASRASKVDAPIFDELPLVAECEVLSYDEETEILIGRIVDIAVDDSVLTDGKVDPMKLRPIAYDPGMHGYYSMTEKVGTAFHDGKKLKNRSGRSKQWGRRPDVGRLSRILYDWRQDAVPFDELPSLSEHERKQEGNRNSRTDMLPSSGLPLCLAVMNAII